MYGLSDEPMDLEGYMVYLQQIRKAFPNLHYEHQHVIAQGEWTATLGMLSGIQRESWAVPAYIAAAPIPLTGRSFSLLHYVIARWRNGEMVEIQVNFDLIGVLEAIGVHV